MGKQMNLEVGIRGLKRGSNILDVRVPEQLRTRHKSGITWFDDALGGTGFAPSTSMMLTGGPGCGKTTLLLQLADSLSQQGHVALFNTGEESLYQVKLVAERLKLKKGFICGQDTMAAAVIAHARELQAANKGKQVFIIQDSLQTLDDGKYGNGGTTGATPLRCCEMLTDWAKSTYGIVVFIGQVNKNGDFSGKNGIRHAVDVHTKLYFDDEKNSETYGERLFETTKNRFGCSGRTYVLGLESDGLWEKGFFKKKAQ
jgi:DNA repair protein RadA/Sms